MSSVVCATTKLGNSKLIQITGMFLWVNLILALLETSSSLQELNSNVNELPKDLEDMSVKANDFSK